MRIFLGVSAYVFAEESKRFHQFDLSSDLESTILNISMHIHTDPELKKTCTCGSPTCHCNDKPFRHLHRLKSTSGFEKNGWNPGGQGEGPGEPMRSSMGGDFRYTAGRQGTDQQDPKAWQSQQSQPGQGQGDWQKYLGQGQGDWQKYLGPSQDSGQPQPEPVSMDSLFLFNFTITGRDITVDSSFGQGSGAGGGGGGGGGQHSISIQKGSVTFLGSSDGALSVK